MGARRRISFRDYRPRRREAERLGEPPPEPIERDAGFRVFGPGEVPGADAVVEAARQVVEAAADDGLAWRRTKKHMAKHLLDPATQTMDSPFVRFALSEPVVRRVTDYLGIVPLLAYADVWLSRYVPEPPRSSQLYHCDNAELSQVKVFVHCSHVTAASGPLTVIDAQRSHELMRRVGYRFGRGGNRIRDDEFRELAGPDRERPLEGPAGTVCFVDTSRCFHFGSRVSEGAPPRLVAMFQYVSPSAFFLPPDFREGAPFRHLAGDGMSDLHRLVLGAA